MSENGLKVMIRNRRDRNLGGKNPLSEKMGKQIYAWYENKGQKSDAIKDPKCDQGAQNGGGDHRGALLSGC